METTPIPSNTDDYIATFPPETQERLILMRDTIRKAAPDAEEKISYRMPAYTLKGMLVYFAGHTRHIGFYPLTTAMKKFKNDLTQYHTSKGGIQFPYSDPLPVGLIKRIVEFRVAENMEKAEAKTLLKKSKMK
jgi:uncharacterized protein YdhG (YjbR/CyaY superfamily)